MTGSSLSTKLEQISSGRSLSFLCVQLLSWSKTLAEGIWEILKYNVLSSYIIPKSPRIKEKIASSLCNPSIISYLWTHTSPICLLKSFIIIEGVGKLLIIESINNFFSSRDHTNFLWYFLLTYNSSLKYQRAIWLMVLPLTSSLSFTVLSPNSIFTLPP